RGAGGPQLSRTGTIGSGAPGAISHSRRDCSAAACAGTPRGRPLNDTARLIRHGLGAHARPPPGRATTDKERRPLEQVLRPLIVFTATVAVTVCAGWLTGRALRYSARTRPRSRLPILLRRVQAPWQIFLSAVALHTTYPLAELNLAQDTMIRTLLATTAILAAIWLVVRGVDVAAENMLHSYADRTRDVAKGRQLRTQLGLVRRIVTAILAVSTAAVAILLLVPSLRTLGTSLLASAGVIGIIAGVAAQSTLSNLIAGLQIAFGDSVKIGDTVVVEGEWGT